DPIGYGDRPNWYAYVHNDPINATDPLGLESEIIIEGKRLNDPGCAGHLSETQICGGSMTTSTSPSGPGGDGGNGAEIVITATRTHPKPPPPLPTPGYPPLIRRPTQIPRYDAAVAQKQDYCGSDASGTAFVPDAPFGRSIVDACKTHDACYSSSTDRYRCDLGLMVDAYNECRRDGGSNSQCAIIGEIYFLGVRVGGWLSYTGTGRSR